MGMFPFSSLPHLRSMSPSLVEWQLLTTVLLRPALQRPMSTGLSCGSTSEDFFCRLSSLSRSDGCPSTDSAHTASQASPISPAITSSPNTEVASTPSGTLFPRPHEACVIVCSTSPAVSAADSCARGSSWGSSGRPPEPSASTRLSSAVRRPSECPSDPFDRLGEQRAGECEVESDVAGADLTAEASLGDGHFRPLIEALRKMSLEPVSAQVEPRQIGALRRNIGGVGQKLCHEVGEMVPIALEIGRDLGEPVAAVGVGGGGGDDAGVRRRSGDELALLLPHRAILGIGEDELRALESGDVEGLRRRC